jgi:hypothetical protein
VAEPFHTSLRVDNINCSRLMSGCVQPSCSPQHPSHLASSLSCRHDAMGRSRKQPRSSSAKSKEKQPGSSSAAVAETEKSKEKQAGSRSAAVAATGKSKEKQAGSSSAAVAATGMMSKEKKAEKGKEAVGEGDAAPQFFKVLFPQECAERLVSFSSLYPFHLCPGDRSGDRVVSIATRNCSFGFELVFFCVLRAGVNRKPCLCCSGDEPRSLIVLKSGLLAPRALRAGLAAGGEPGLP